MEMRLLPALFLFFGSYFPLSLILLIQDIKETSWKSPICSFTNTTSCYFPELANPEIALGVLGVCTVSLLLFILMMKNLKGFSTLDVVESKTIPNDLINYVFPYVVSFMGLDLGIDGKLFGFLLFIGLMFLITYRSGQMLMNPLLLVAGWQLYDLNVVIEGHKRSIKALSKEQVRVGDRLKSCLVHGIYVLHRGEK
jgi:hypothetical protein